MDGSDRLYAEVAKSHARRNCLVIGPAGSGTLSLVRGLAALTESRARKFLFDWEVEVEAQQKLLADLTTRLQNGIVADEVWILRKIHALSGGKLEQLLRALRSLQESGTQLVICYATSEPSFHPTVTLRELERLFAVRITLGEGGYVRGAFDSILAYALVTLRKKYGNKVSSIEPEAAKLLEEIALQSQLPAMFASLERAFVVETGTRVRASTLLAAGKA